MLILTQRLTSALTAAQQACVAGSATLDIDTRIKSRLKITLDSGEPAGLMLPRGLLIRGGDYLATADGSCLIHIMAKAETVSTAYCADPLRLAKACYHLGNRHVPLQIEADFARYQHDHVLDEMLAQMGILVVVEQAPFEPEAGAYQSAPHSHAHDHDHDHDHSHPHVAEHRLGRGHAHDHSAPAPHISLRRS